MRGMRACLIGFGELPRVLSQIEPGGSVGRIHGNSGHVGQGRAFSGTQASLVMIFFRESSRVCLGAKSLESVLGFPGYSGYSGYPRAYLGRHDMLYSQILSKRSRGSSRLKKTI